MRHIPFQISGLLVLNGVSILGNAITEIAIPWLILEISGSPFLVAVVMSAKILPVILSMFFSAPIVDKYGAFQISIFSDIVNFISVLLIPIFYTIEIMNFYLLAILLILATILDVPGRLAKDIMLAKEIKKNKNESELVNGINSTIENICDLAGPIFGAFMISVLGTINVLYFDAASFLVVALGVLVLKKHFISEVNQIYKMPSQPYHYLLESVKYIKSEREIFSVLIISSIVNFVITPFLIIYLPYINKQEFNSVLSLGVSMMCFGFGTSLSSLFYGIFGKYFSKHQIIIVGYTLLILCFLSLNLIYSQYVFFVQLFVVGCCIGFAGPVEITMIQQQVPENLFGRIMTIFSSTRFFSVPIGYVCFGTILESNIARQTPLIMAGTILCGLLVYLFLLRIHYKN
ncbi:MFS transporter [Xenorhabdus griffiniae]|uniref:MFS transporter n=1 Tax=Xenorhabdus griffiniae TaxID=351672 RepID=UPI0023586C60|nr:MFS transporter [Xenorhabdus griffiniae]MDC9605747.1 MFS transporter [Xenorhabdus griffiniae]